MLKIAKILCHLLFSNCLCYFYFKQKNKEKNSIIL